MPAFSFSVHGFDPQGNRVSLPPGQALYQSGPIIEVVLAVPTALAQKLAAAGRPIPKPVNGLALLDTGATNSCIDEDVARNLLL